MFCLIVGDVSSARSSSGALPEATSAPRALVASERPRHTSHASRSPRYLLKVAVRAWRVDRRASQRRRWSRLNAAIPRFTVHTLI